MKKMSEMCYFLHDDIDMGAHIYTCGHQKEMTWGKCPCKEGMSCDLFVSKSEVNKLVRQYINNREKRENIC